MDLGTIFNYAAIGISILAAYPLSKMFWYTVQQRTEAQITSFGKYIDTVKEGFHLKWPWQKVAGRVSTALQQVGETLDTKTKDNLFVGLPISIQYQVADTAKYFFDTNDNPISHMAKLVSAAVRKYTSGKDFQELYDERDEISEAVISDVKKDVLDYGIDIRRIVIDEPQAPGDVQTAYNEVRASERKKDAAKNEAEADYIRAVKKAEGDKERNILIGQGVAGFRKSIAEGYAGIRNSLIKEGVNPAVADRFMEEAMRLDTIRDIGDKGNMIVVVPDGGASGSSAAQTLQDMLTMKKAVDKVGGAANQNAAEKPEKGRKKASGEGPSPTAG